MADKKRVVIVGNSPLPVENTERTFAPGIRTWHFATAAKDAGFEVLIIGNRIPKSYPDDSDSFLELSFDDIAYCSADPILFEDKTWLSKKISQFKPTCVVSVNTHPSSIVADLDLDIPFWADLNGSAMAEAQAKAFVYDDDSFVSHFFDMESKVLPKADVFSVVSESQGFTLIGELSMFGRLSKKTMGYRFVRVVPNSVSDGEFEHTKNVIRNNLVSKDAFVILYSGGYNTWTDVETMFYGLEKAMEKNSSIEFVSTGGQIDGHDEYTYKHFQNLINDSKFKSRFHLCGWVPHEDLPNYYLESDLGINSDRYCYESLLGARTRTQDWLKACLPFISTKLSEVTSYLIENDLAYSFEHGDSDSLASEILSIAEHKDDLLAKKHAIKEIVQTEFLIKHTLSEFKNWLKKPTFAPDHNSRMILIHPNSSDIQSTSTTESIAVRSWPLVSRVLRKLGLQRFETKIKRLGYGLLHDDLSKLYQFELLNCTFPPMTAKNSHLTSIEIKNIGKATWESAAHSINPVNFAYIWYDQKGNMILRNEKRVPLPQDIPHNHKLTLDAVIESPDEPGEYVLQLDLVKEHQFWFSELSDSKVTRNVTVQKKTSDKHFPSVSVIVVTFNSQDYIEQCLDTLLQSTIPLEIIVVDNASTDNTTEILEHYDKKVKIIKSTENLGFAGGNNLGIKNSKGNIIALINPDAYVKPDSIEKMAVPLVNDETVIITGPKIYYPKTTKIQSAGGILRPNALPYHLGYGLKDNAQFDLPRTVDYVTGAAMAIKRNLFEMTGLFDPIYNPAYYEETEKCIQARKLGYKILYVPDSVVYHHESTTLTALSEKFLTLFHTNRFKFVYRNFGVAEYLKFILSELKWFVVNCGSKEKRIVLRTHINALLSTELKIKRKVPLN